MKKIFITAVLTFLFVLGLSGAAWAESVDLEWDATTDNVGVIGYKIHYGTSSGVYNNSVDVGMNLTATIDDLLVGTTYFFVATASDAAGNESDYSNEVNYLAVDKTLPSKIINLKIIIIVQ